MPLAGHADVIGSERASGLDARTDGVDGQSPVNSQELDILGAIEHLAALIVPLEATERCLTAAACNRVLAADVFAGLDVPAFPNAAMDGYAVRAADCIAPTTLRVVGRALAGHPFGAALRAGEAVRIMTGASLPAGADAVVMQEDVRTEADRVHVSTAASGANVRPQGEHLRRGEVVLARGRRLRPYDVGLAATAGAAELTVFRRLRVGVLSTGDELHDPPDPRGLAGQFDGNRPTLFASLARAGHDVHDLGIVADRAEALEAALAASATLRLDAVVSSGGVAQGDADIVRRFPALEFVPLAIRPGRGLACGRVHLGEHGQWFFGLPGNSVAAYVVFHLLVAPLLAHMSGARAEPPLTLTLPLAVAAHTRAGQTDWRRARLVRRYGGLAVEPLAQQSSSMLRTLSEAHVLVAIGPQAALAAGDPVEVIPLAALD
jgi:molybdopterin molybdotransferase